MRSLALLPILFAAACVSSGDTSDVGQEVAGTPDELALIRFLNDRNTEVDTLDHAVALDSRAAKNLIAHRDGNDGLSGSGDDNLFDDAAEVDAVPYVGPTAMDKMIAYANAGGWVHDDDLFGTFDGVAYTVAQARAAIPLVNTASDTTLHTTIGLDARAVKSILAARPLTTMAQLASLYYVGASALTKIRTYVTPQSCTDADYVAQLATAIDGFDLTSESDYPLETVSYAGKGSSGGDTASFLAVLGLPASTPIHVNTLDWMFERLASNNDTTKVDALRTLMTQHLTSIVVYEVGTIQVHDYVVGVTACGGLVGITGISIET